jgi:Tol biopolymer transport system component
VIVALSITSDIILQSDGNIFTVRLDGSGKTYLTNDGGSTTSPGLNGDAAWSYDGAKIAYLHQAPAQQAYIWTMNADGSDKQQLTFGNLTGLFPIFSEDRKSILFTHYETDNYYELWVMNADGTNPRRLTSTSGTAVTRKGEPLRGSAYGSYSPDGGKIVYASTESGHTEIWVMNADGSGRTQLTFPSDPNAPDANAPAWSPDGSKIVFWSGFETEYGNVYTMNADGSGRTQLTFEQATTNSDNPAWSSDGGYITFERGVSSSQSVTTWIMQADGSDQRLLFPAPTGSSRLPIKGMTTVWGSAGDTIDANTVAGGDLLIDASGTFGAVTAGPLTIAGGGRATTVWGGAGDRITGGAGALQVSDTAHAGGETVVGGTGSLSVFDIGPNFSITGSTAATTFVDDSYGGGGNSRIAGGGGTVTGAGGLAVNTVIIGAAGDTIVGGSGTTYVDGIFGAQSISGGAGATTVQAGAGDTIASGIGPLQVYLDSDQAGTTVDLGAGHGTAKLRDVSVAGGGGGAVSVTGFDAASDVIQSKTSVQAGDFRGTSSSDGSGGTILIFVDGARITLAGISDPSKIAFTS